MSVPNQDIVIAAKRKEYDKDHMFFRVHTDSLQQAVNALTGESLKLWLYLNRFKDEYKIELSRADCEKWGLKRTAYYTAKEKLIGLHYLVPKRKGSNTYYFYEDLQDGEEAYKKLSENYKDSFEKSKTEPIPNDVCIIPELYTGNSPDLYTRKTGFLQRNTIYNTIYNKNNTPHLPNPDTLPIVKKEEMDKIPGEKVKVGEGIIYSTYTQKAYRIE